MSAALKLPPLPIEPSRVEVLPSRQAWASSRLMDYRIGGSDVSKILNRCPESHGGPWQFWLSRKHPSILTRDDESAEQRRGKRYERRVLEDYAHDFGIQTWTPREFFGTAPESEIVIHGAEAWMVMTPDAFGFDPLAGLWGIPEAKTSAMAEEWGPSQDIPVWREEYQAVMPVHIVLQGYWYLEISGLPWLDVVVLIVCSSNSGLNVRRYRLHADRFTQAQLVAAVSAWRERYLLGEEVPPVTPEDECRNFLGTRFGKSETFRDPTDDELIMAVEFVALRQRIKADTARAKMLEAALLGSMAESGGLYIPSNKPSRAVLKRVYVAPHKVEPYTVPGRTQPASAYLKIPKE